MARDYAQRSLTTKLEPSLLLKAQQDTREGQEAMAAILDAMEATVVDRASKAWRRLNLGSDHSMDLDDVIQHCRVVIIGCVRSFKVPSKHSPWSYLCGAVTIGIIQLHERRNRKCRIPGVMKVSLDSKLDPEDRSLLDKLGSPDNHYVDPFQDLNKNARNITITRRDGTTLTLDSVIDRISSLGTVNLAAKALRVSRPNIRNAFNKLRASLNKVFPGKG